MFFKYIHNKIRQKTAGHMIFTIHSFSTVTKPVHDYKKMARKLLNVQVLYLPNMMLMRK